MSEILKRIREDLKRAMTTEIKIRKNKASGDFIVSQLLLLDKCHNQKDVSRAIISMFPEIGVKPTNATDDDTIKLLKKYIRSEKERLLYTIKHITESDVNGISASDLKKLVNKKSQELGDSLNSPEIDIAKSYLPKQATEEEISAWIHENIDFSI